MRLIQNGPSSRIYGQSSAAQAASQSNAAAGKSLGGIRGQILNYVKSVKQQHEDDGVSVEEIIKVIQHEAMGWIYENVRKFYEETL